MAGGRIRGLVGLVAWVTAGMGLAQVPTETTATGLGARVREAWPQSLSRPVVFNVNRAYGSLAFRGVVERIDLGEEYESRPHIAITFRPNERPNPTPVANLQMCVLVATMPGEGEGRVTLLSRETEPIAVVLTADRESKSMPEVTFRLPKSIAAQAGHIGLAVTDGRMLWPIPIELRL